MLFDLPDLPSIRSIKPRPGLNLMLLAPLLTLNPERMLAASARPKKSGLGGVASGAESSELSSELRLARGLRMLKKRRVLAVLRVLLGDMLPGALSE